MSPPTLTSALIRRFTRRQSIASPSDLRCPACGGAGENLSMAVEPGCRLVRCLECRTQYLRQQQSAQLPGVDETVAESGTDSEYWEQYKFGVYSSDDVKRGYEERYAFAFDLVRGRFAALRTVLDVGCGIGNFLDWAMGQGLDGVGLDVDETAIAAAQDRGLAVGTPDDLDRMIGKNGKVDVLTMWDVIEHVFDPHAFVGQIVDRLTPGGALVLETPDGEFPVRALLRGLHRLTGGRIALANAMYYWEHKIYFTEEGLRRLLDTHGCDVVEVRRLTSPRAKMQRTFSHYADGGGGSLASRTLAAGWPAAETAFRQMGWGNKLIVVARRRG